MGGGGCGSSRVQYGKLEKQDPLHTVATPKAAVYAHEYRWPTASEAHVRPAAESQQLLRKFDRGRTEESTKGQGKGKGKGKEQGEGQGEGGKWREEQQEEKYYPPA